MHQCSAGLQRTASYGPTSSSIDTEVSDNFDNHGCICKKKSSGRPRVSDVAVRHVEATSSRSARKFVRKGRCELQMWQVRTKHCNATLPNRCIGELELQMKSGRNSLHLSQSHCMWVLYVGLCKGTSVCATLPLDINGLTLTVTAAIETIDRIMLRVQDELDYRLDICRVTNGAHIEQLKAM
jgi:hypothetical protein